MKIKKLSVVLTFAISLTIAIHFMINSKGYLKTSSIINIDDKNISGNVTEVSTTKLAKEKRNEIKSGKVTSRSGMRKPLETTSTLENSEPETNNTDNNAENPVEEPIEEPAKPTFQGVELQYSARYNITSARLSKSKGVTYYNGHKETYYSQRVLSGKGLRSLNNNGRHVADDGTVRDGDGYIAVACNYLPKGSTIMTSLGPGKVYDTGGMTGKWIDIYVNW